MRDFVTEIGPFGGTFEVLAWGETSITLAVGTWTVEHNGVGLRAATPEECARGELSAPIAERLRKAHGPFPLGHLPSTDPQYNNHRRTA